MQQINQIAFNKQLIDLYITIIKVTLIMKVIMNRIH